MTLEDDLSRWFAGSADDDPCGALPPAAYTSPDMLALERERVFGRGWIVVAHSSELKQAGDYRTFDLAGHPVLIVRDREGELRAYSNVCPHRSALIAEGCGNRTVFQCPYHAWTYDLTGKLVGAPHMDKAAVKDVRLKDLRCETWQGFVFVNLDDRAAPLAEGLAALTPRAEPYRMEELEVVAHEVLDVACNWKVLIENFCESYHVFCVHKKTLEDATPTASIENLPGGAGFNHHTMQSNETWALDAARKLGVPANGTTANNLVCIFPAMALSMDPGSALWLSAMPDGPDAMKAHLWLGMTGDGERGGSDGEQDMSWQFCKTFLAEDIAVIEGIQKGLRAGTGNRAPLHPWEATNREFGRYLVRQLDLAGA